MATITVLKFSTADGANNTVRAIQDLQDQHLVQVHDAAIVSWPAGKKIPRTRDLADMAGAGALGGMYWGMLFGLIFFTPLFGMAAGFGSLGSLSREFGMDDDFMKRVRSQVTEGTSALFLMTSGAVVDRVADAMKTVAFEIIATNLSEEQEQNLRDVFGQN